MRFDVLTDKDGPAKIVMDNPDMLSVTILVGDNQYVRVDVSTKIESKKDMLNAFVRELEQAMNEFISQKGTWYIPHNEEVQP